MRDPRVRIVQEELALALDAGGQVYIFGVGENNEFAGTVIPPKSVVSPFVLLTSESNVVACSCSWAW